MRIRPFDYAAVTTTEEASELLGEPGHTSLLLAGGTDLLPAMKLGLARPSLVVDLRPLSELVGIEVRSNGGLRIGSLTTIQTIEKSPVIARSYPALQRAAELIGSPQLRSVGTVGGNLLLDTRCCYYNQSDFWRSCRPTCLKAGGTTCNVVGGGRKCFAVFAADLASALVALGAYVELRSARGARKMPLCRLYTTDGVLPFAKDSDEVLAAVELPPISPHASSAYQKLRLRSSLDFPAAGVAVSLDIDLDGGACRAARLVLSGVASGPVEVEEAEQALIGNVVGGKLIEKVAELAWKRVKPVANVAGISPSYRRHMVSVLVGRALRGVA